MHVFSVSELTSALRSVLEGEFPFVWVRGQAVNVSRPLSGHVYFTVRDGESVLPVVWFRGRQGGAAPVDPVTGEVFEEGSASPQALLPEEGRETLVAGRITAYAPRGVYQLVAEVVQDAGVSSLALALETLKNQLGAEGLFDAARKRPVPRNPRRVAVVTAPQGAALQDFVRVASTRGLGAVMRLYASPVQGDEAPSRLQYALTQVAADAWAEVVVLLRGGGSLEDLWAFNTEMVVRAIAACPVPVVTGVGHEVDTTLADLAADLRAATPTHAAQLLWEDREVLAQRLDDAALGLGRAVRGHLGRAAQALTMARERLAWVSPALRVQRAGLEVARLRQRLQQAGLARVHREHEVLAGLGRRLESWGTERVRRADDAVRQATDHLARAGAALWEGKAREAAVLSARLSAMDPAAPLARGFAVVRRNGQVVRSAGAVRPGERLQVGMHDGVFGVVVEDV